MVELNIAEQEEQLEATTEKQDTPTVAEAPAPVEAPAKEETPASRAPGIEDVLSALNKERERTRSLEVRLEQLARQNKDLLSIKPLIKRGMAEEDITAAEDEAKRLQEQQELEQYTATQVAALNRTIDRAVKRLGKDMDKDAELAPVKQLIARGALGDAIDQLDLLVEAAETAKAEERRIARQTRQEKLDIATPRPAAAAIQITEDNADVLHAQGKISDEQYRFFLRARGIL